MLKIILVIEVIEEVIRDGVLSTCNSNYRLQRSKMHGDNLHYVSNILPRTPPVRERESSTL